MPQSTVPLVRRNDAPKVDPEFAALIAPLTPEERRQLEANIAAEGCRDALVVWKGILLDGRNRLEICTRLGIRYKVSQIELTSREAAKIWIEENQIGRRNLSPDQRAAIAYRLLQRRIELSKKERARKGGLRLVDTSSTKKKQRQRELTAAQCGVATRKVRLVGEIVAKHDSSIVGRIAAGKISLKDAKFEVHEQIRKRQRDVALKSHPNGAHIHTGSLSILRNILEDDSVDLFLTDPPYQESAVPLYGSLAELAARKLKPGGLCAVLCGQLFFDRVFQEMAKHLDYYWLCGVAGGAGAGSTRVVSRRILNVLRPVLVFAKRPLVQRSSLPFMLDLISGVRDKQHHSWGQGVMQFQYLIENLSEPGQLVIDPFVGGGTVPVACIASGRRCIGAEIDPGVAAAARVRVAEFRKSQSKDHRIVRTKSSP
jgi:DNA methylase